MSELGARATSSTCGKAKRLRRILGDETEPRVFVPIDDSLLAGPINGLQRLEVQVPRIASAGPDAIMGFPGTFRRLAAHLIQTPTILNLTASTTLSRHTRKTVVAFLEQAHALACDAVAVHVNVSSQFETEMLSILGETAIECDRAGMPLLGIMYPRREDGAHDDNFEALRRDDAAAFTTLVAHAVRVGCELGVDLIKTPFTGSVATFRRVIEAACGVPVVTAGGPLCDAATALSTARAAVEAGGAGVSFGRNVFGRADPGAMIAALRAVMGGQDPDRALSQFPTALASCVEAS